MATKNPNFKIQTIFRTAKEHVSPIVSPINFCCLAYEILGAVECFWNTLYVMLYMLYVHVMYDV